MNDTTDNLLGIIPPLIIGGTLMMFTKKFLEEPKKKRKYFDKQEYKDLKSRSRLGFGDFSNIGF